MNQTQQDGEQAFALHQKISSNELERRKLLGENIVLLKGMKDTQLFKSVLGDENAEWAAYLGQIETMYSRNEIYNLIRIHDKFVSELNISFHDICDIPVSRLIDLLPVIDMNNLESFLANARSLTNQDFKNSIRSFKGLSTTDDGHKHNMVEYAICSDCGFRHKNESTKSI